MKLKDWKMNILENFTYIEQQVLSDREKELFAIAENLSRRFFRSVTNVTCHSVVEHIVTWHKEDFIHEKGTFGQFHEHSWLRIKETNGNKSRFIIDVYPVACAGGPILVDTGENLSLPTPWKDLYNVGEKI